MEQWHQALEADKSDPDPRFQAIRDAWTICDRGLNMEGGPVQSRGRLLQDTANAPFAAMIYFIESGVYPPPELLFAVAETWHAYLQADGKLSLEDTFLGRPLKSSGNYAKRKGAQFRNLRIMWELARLTREGNSRMEAAEIISQALGGKPDADSILRIARGIRKVKTERDPQPENNRP